MSGAGRTLDTRDDSTAKRPRLSDDGKGMTSSRQDAPHSGGKGSAVPPAAAAAATEQQEGPLGRHRLVDRTQYIRLLEQVCKYSAVRPCTRPFIVPLPSRLALPSCGWMFTAQHRRSCMP